MGTKGVIFAVLSWLFAALCAVAAVRLFPSVSGILLAVTAVLALPVKPIRRIWNKLLDFRGGDPTAAKALGKAAMLALAAVVSLALSAKSAQPVIHPVNASPADRGIAAVTDESVTADETESETADAEVREYVINKSSKKFHLPTCASVSKIAEKNREDVTASREELITDGYSPCGSCKP